jgi:nitrogen fixation protein NifU and related proteins
MGLENLYREVILDHYRNPRNRGAVEGADATGQGVNPLCGDEVILSLRFEDDRVAEVAVEGQGCSISQASASMMSEAIKGKTRDEIDDLVARFRGLMGLEGGTDPDIDPERPGAGLGDMEALQGVRQYPVRIKCAALPWTVLQEALA